MKKCNFKDDPNWNLHKPCLQDHEHTVNNYSYTTTVTCTIPFNVPRPDQDLELTLDNVISILPQSILWNPNVGNLHVKSFDSETSTVIVETYENELNVDYGTAMIANTKFLVGIPTAIEESLGDASNNPYLAADFISPDIGSCQIASVTNVNGITNNSIVSISGYLYTITILNKSTVTLCNTGDGATKDTVIYYDTNNCGTPTVPIISYETSPCEATPVHAGNIVVCNSNNTKSILTGEADGQILRWNLGRQYWELFNFSVDETCTYLTACFTVDTQNQSYVATVASTSLFSLDNKLEIENVIFVVTEVVSNTELRLTPETTFTEITIYPVGTLVCLQNCCSWLPAELANIESDTWRPTSLETISIAQIVRTYLTASSETLVSISAGGTTNLTVTTDTVSITNTNTEYEMLVYVRLYCYSHGCISNIASFDASKRINIKSEASIEYTLTNWDPVTQAEIPIISNVSSYTTNCYVPIEIQSAAGLTIIKESAFVLPVYNPEHQALSRISVKGSNILSVFGQSSTDVSYMWSSSPATFEKGSEEVIMVVEGVIK